MADDTNPSPEKNDGPVIPSGQKDSPDSSNNDTAPHPKPPTETVPLWQLFRCRFNLWRERRRISKPSRERARWTDIGILILTAGVAFAAGLSAWIFEGQLKTMQSQLAITDRPWVKGEPQAWSSVTFQNNGDLSINVTFALNNVGHSVATDVTVYAAAFVPKWDGDQHFKLPIKRQRELCGKVQPYPLTVTMFPGDTKQFNVGLGISRQEIEANIVPLPPGMNHPPDPPGKRTDPILFGCVDYQFSNLPGHHQTGFIYDIVRTNPKTPNVPYLIIVGNTLPAANVSLQRWGFGGDYAN